MKPLFLYLKSSEIKKSDLQRLRQAGYILLLVESFESIKLINVTNLSLNEPISKAALLTIKKQHSLIGKGAFAETLLQEICK